MNKHRLILLVICLASMQNCKNTNGDKESKSNPQDRLIISFETKLQKDDVFEIYYRMGDIPYNSDMRISQTVRGGTEEFEKMEFVLEPLEFPTHVRIDLGSREQPFISIRNLELRYNDGIHQFTPEEFKKFFRPNQFVEMDFNNMNCRTKKVEGKFDPYIISYNLSYFVNKLLLH